MSWWLLPAAVAVCVLSGLSIFLCIRRPPAPLWPVALLCQVAALVWVTGDLLTYFAADVTQKQLALAVLFTGSLLLPSLWWITAVLYVRSHHIPWPWVYSRWVMLPAIMGPLAWLTMATNPLHGRFVTVMVGARSEYHAAATPLVIGCMGLIIAASMLFLGLSRHVVSRDVRDSARILAFAAFAPLLATGAYFFSGWEIPIDPVGIGLSLASGSMIWGIYRTGLFSLLPVALTEVLRHDPNGFLLVGRGGRLLYWNPAAERILAGLRLAPELDFFRALRTVLRMPGGEPLMVDDPEALALVLCRPPDSSRSHLYRLRRPDRWLRITAAPVPSRKGRADAVSVRIEDVTPLQRLERERLELEAKVRHAEKLKSLGLLADGIAHDFNNLLGSILGNANLALQRPVPGAELQSHLEEIETAATQAADLTLQLLTYGGNAPSEPRRVELSLLVTEMVRLLDVSVSGRATLQTELTPSPAAVRADPSQLRQLVMNLITNAAEAVDETGVDGLVTLTTRSVDVPEPRTLDLACGRLEAGRHVVLEVTDTGIGMSELTRSRIFDPFFTTKRDGRGLGMAVVYGCVRALRGAVEVETEPGEGTTFRVYLPEAPGIDEELAEPALPPVEQAGDWRGSGTVLVVDDQPAMLRATASILRQAGFETLEAGSGREGIDAFRRHGRAIDLVVLDLTMPDVGGEEVLQEIRRLAPDTPVILSSGFAENEVMRRLESRKISGFLQKPYPMRALLAMMRRILGT